MPTKKSKTKATSKRKKSAAVLKKATPSKKRSAAPKKRATSAAAGDARPATIFDKTRAAAYFVEKLAPFRPEIAVVLGSGLGPLADHAEIMAEIPTTKIPYYPPSTVEGHEGRFIFGRLGGKNVVLLKGRIHGYEGYPFEELVMPIRIMNLLGAHGLILTNAAGGIREGFRQGDLMLIEDHLNLLWKSPLSGPNDDSFGPRFPDMTDVWTKSLRALADSLAVGSGIHLRSGVYASLPGPQYETPAEIRMLRTLGADAVGMSTVPEAIAARHMGMSILGISVITNLAAGLSSTELSHEEVMETGRSVGDRLAKLVTKMIAAWPTDGAAR